MSHPLHAARATAGRQRRSRRPVLAACLAGATLLAAAGGCSNNFDPASYVNGLRVLMITGQPPEVAPGHSTSVRALVVDTQGRPIDVAWFACLQPPLQGQAVSPACVSGQDGGSLQPLGTGMQVTVAVPAMPSIKTLGLPDASGGLYLPLVAQVAAGSDSLVATYGLRVDYMGEPLNQNPQLASVSTVTAGPGGAADAGGAGEVVTPIDAATPLPVHAGDQLTLRVAFAAGSAESYQITTTSTAGQMMTRTVSETLSVSYFVTAGTLSGGTSGVERPDEVLALDKNLPPSGGTIDLWVVGRDERGGADALHRTLVVQ
jgi:hypothetical protein